MSFNLPLVPSTSSKSVPVVDESVLYDHQPPPWSPTTPSNVSPGHPIQQSSPQVLWLHPFRSHHYLINSNFHLQVHHWHHPSNGLVSQINIFPRKLLLWKGSKLLVIILTMQSDHDDSDSTSILNPCIISIPWQCKLSGYVQCFRWQECIRFLLLIGVVASPASKY